LLAGVLCFLGTQNIVKAHQLAERTAPAWGGRHDIPGPQNVHVKEQQLPYLLLLHLFFFFFFFFLLSSSLSMWFSLFLAGYI
jgi:hypothetical protein